MSTKCSTQGVLFPDVAGRDAVVQFNAGDVTSNGGVLMLERAEPRVELSARARPWAGAQRRLDGRVGRPTPPRGFTRIYERRGGGTKAFSEVT